MQAATEKIPVTVRWLSMASDEEFEHAVQDLDVRELLQLISHLQQEMTNEQGRFDELGDRLRDRRERLRRLDDDLEADREIKTLSSALCRSQIRLAQLCSRNMRCFTQQETIRAQMDLRKSNQETTWPRSSSSSPSPSPSPPPHRPSHSDSSEEGGDYDGRGRVPSVQDILQSVRALRLSGVSTQEPPPINNNYNVRQRVRDDVIVPSPDYNSAEEDNNDQSVVWHQKSVSEVADKKNDEQQSSSNYDDDSLSSRVSSDLTPPPTIHRSVLSCPELVAKFQHESQDQRSVPSETISLPSTRSDEEDVDEDDNDDDDDDVDSGVGTEEGPKRLFGGGFGRRRRQRKSLFDHMSNTESLSNHGESVTTITSNNIVPSKPHVGISMAEEDNDDDDVEEVIPSIIEQFCSPAVDQHETDGRTRKTNVSWNPERLLSNLYKIPVPLVPASPPASYLNMEGYLETLPSGRRQATYWNAWKRRYFRLKDGFLYCYQNAKSDEASICLQLMGGRVDAVESSLLGVDDGLRKKRSVKLLRVDDGKGHYLVLRCGKGSDTERWRRALITHTAENYSQTYVHPVLAYPQFYEDVILIDIGSCSVRAGVLCNQPTLPQVYFPTVCAKDRTTGQLVYGIEALRPIVRKNSSLSFPLKPSAKITKFTVNLEAVNGILRRVFADLNVDPSDYQVQLSLPRSFPFRSQADVLDLLMTEFGVRSVNLTAQTVLALLSYRTTSGVVVDVGERTEIVPIIDGYVVESGVSRTPYGGSRLCDHLRHFLMQRHCGLVSETESFLLRYVLENACYCAERYRTELQAFCTDPNVFEMTVALGQFFDGDAPWESITLGNGRFQAPEGIFNPDAWGLDNQGIHKLVSKAIQECGLDARKEMSRCIYLSGGVTMLPGFTERLQQEMNRLTPPSITPKVHASPYRAHAAYLGACVWASGAGFHQAKITRNDWVAKGSACLKKWHF